MNILMVGTNPDLITKEGGATVRRRKLAVLFSHNNDIVYLDALPKYDKGINIKSNHFSDAALKAYYFKQLFIFGKCAQMLTDLNIAFLLRIKDIVKREKIDLICITHPFGVISTSLTCPHTPVVYDAHGIISEHAKLYVERLKMDFKVVRVPLINKIVKWLLLNYIRLLERLTCQRAKHVIAITKLDRQRLIEKYTLDRNKITAIPVWMTVDNFNKVFSKRKESAKSFKINIIFLGIYRHPANYEAFKLIEDYIAPEVKKYNANIEFILAGTDVPQFEKENLKSVGYVEDLSATLRDSDIAIVPILQGTGVRVKILDYMAAGLPIITTKQAIQGIEAENGKHAIILNAVDDNFINAILSLAGDKQRREMLGKNAMEFIKKEYNRANIQSKLDKMLIKIKGGVKN